MSWLSDRLSEASAQLNTRDGGKSAVTVRRDRNAQVAQTVRKKQEQDVALQNTRRYQNQVNRQALNNGRINSQQYQQESNRIFGTNTPQSRIHSYKNTRMTPNSVVHNVFDSNTDIDKQARLLEGRPEMYRDEQIAMGNKRPMENLGAQIVGNTERFGNTAMYGLHAGVETARGGVADVTDNQKALTTSLTRQKNIRDYYGEADSGLGGVGTIFNTPEEMTNLGNAEIAKRVGLTTLGTASEVLPFARVARPVTAGAKGAVALYKGGKPITTGLVKSANLAERGGAGLTKRAMFNAGMDTVTGAGESVARQYAQTGQVNPLNVLADTGASVVLGQTQLVPAYAKAIGNSDQAVKVRAKTKPLGTVSDDVSKDSVFQSLEKKIDTTVQRMSQATGKLKENYRQEALEYIRQRNARVAELSQGGFIKLGDDGKKSVVVTKDQHIFKDKPQATYPKIAKDYLNTNLKGKVITVDDGGNITIDSKGIKKFTNPTQDSKNLDIKMRLAPELDNAVEISKRRSSVADRGGKHGNFAKDGFDYRSFKFEIDNQEFVGTINVGKNGEVKNFYDVHPIKELPDKSRSRLSGSPVDGDTVSPNGAPNGSIPNNSKPVNPIKGLEKYDQLSTPVKVGKTDANIPQKGLVRNSLESVQTQDSPVQSKSKLEQPSQQSKSQQELLVKNPVLRPSQKSGSSSFDTKIQQKTPVVNDARRAVGGAERTTFGLRDSFNANENVPKELKEALGAFGNERTVRSNKELWQTSQKRVSDDPAEAMRFFKDNNSDDAVATGYALINKNMKEGNSKAAGEIAIEMAERALETGRTNQAYALMKRLTPEGSISYVEKKVQRFIKDNPNMAKKVKWDDKVRSDLYKMADDLNKLPEGRERNLAIGKLQERIDNIFPSGKLDKAVTIWKAGLLTSLRTHERNILGNSINLAAEQSAVVPGSLADRLMSLRTRKRTLTATPGKNMGSGVKVGGQIAKDQLMTGIDVNNTNIKYNINHITWNDNKVEKALKGYTEAVFRPLGAEDKIFKESIRANSLYNQVAAEAKNKGLKGAQREAFIDAQLKDPSPKMMDIADDDASRGTFTHENFLGDIIKNAKGAVRKSNKPGSKAASAFLDILMPFTQVPSGVASQLYAYSPAKLLKSFYDISKVMITGDETLQRKAAQGFGRSALGTSLIGAGAYLASNGLMTGDPKDDQEKAQWEAQGIKPNSIKLGDKWYGLQSVGPQFILALAGAQWVADKENGDEPFGKMAANIGNSFTEQTFLKGMSSFIDAIKEPERNLDFYIQSQATSIIPNVVKDLTKSIDPNERQTNSTVDKFKSGIPIISKGLPERKDSYGQTIKNSGALEMVDLFNSSKQKDVPEAQLIDSLRESTGEKVHTPAKATKSVNINGETKKLSSQEQSDYQGYIGNNSKDSIELLTNAPQYSNRFNQFDDGQKVKFLDSFFQDVNSAAKVSLFGNEPDSVSKTVQSLIDGDLKKALDLKLRNIEEKSTTTTKTSTPKTASKSKKKTSAKKKSSGRKSKKGKFDTTKMFAFGSNPTSINKSLRQLLENALVS
jgi:hypothetical protein